jgi:Flp pilus assembly protein TadD
MKTRNKLLIGMTVIAAGGAVTATVAPHGLGLSAYASAGSNAKKAVSEAKEARKAISKRKAEAAVSHAEAAVANDPQNAEYRALLGQAYLLSGRFTSAAQALNDTLTLNPEDGRAALNLALAKVAQGDWAGARATLDSHGERIGASDRGLAYALAGDPVKAVEILMPAVREADATAKTRQNLALSFALAGRWAEARQVAAVDVAPDQLDARIMQWAHFARPTNAYDQVASLLGVTAVSDAGQPVQLALVQQPNVMVAAAAPAPVADPVQPYAPAPEAAPAVVEAPVAVAEPDPVAAPIAEDFGGTDAQVVFGPRQEIIQRVPVSAVKHPSPAPLAVATKAPKAVRALATTSTIPAKLARGTFYVQLGAYDSSAVAKDAWGRVTRHVPSLSGQNPYGASVKTAAGSFYRLSVGGFARTDADALCREVKASGQPCFVRAGAGDMLASWVRPGKVQTASK